MDKKETFGGEIAKQLPIKDIYNDLARPTVSTVGQEMCIRDRVSSSFPKFSFINVNPKLKDLSFNYLKKLLKCDLIFDVTMGDSFSDIYSVKYYQGLIRHKRIAEFVCKKYILLPQTYGPFSSLSAEVIAKKVFDKAYRIYCRDEISQNLLKDKFEITDSILASDMAFVLPYDKGIYHFSDRKKIGINVSGLLYKGCLLYTSRCV